jgi:hypothetical protein
VPGTGGAVTDALLMTALPFVANAAGTVPVRDAAAAAEPGVLVDVTLTINGHPHRLQLNPRTTLLDVLRVHVAMRKPRSCHCFAACTWQHWPRCSVRWCR